MDDRNFPRYSFLQLERIHRRFPVFYVPELPLALCYLSIFFGARRETLTHYQVVKLSFIQKVIARTDNVPLRRPFAALIRPGNLVSTPSVMKPSRPYIPPNNLPHTWATNDTK